MVGERPTKDEQSDAGRRRGPVRRSLTVGISAALIGTAIGLPLWLLSLSGPVAPRAQARAIAARCPTAAASVRAANALAAAEARYRMEERGTVIHTDLHQIASDGGLTSALATGNLGAALSAADRQLVRHVVQIRVISGSRVLIDANPTSFDVAGSTVELRGARGRRLGTLQITVQDVIGFIKLVHKLDAADVVVRGTGGQMRTSLSVVPLGSLPGSGCVKLGARRYVVSSFHETSYTGEPLTIWLLTAP